MPLIDVSTLFDGVSPAPLRTVLLPREDGIKLWYPRSVNAITGDRFPARIIAAASAYSGGGAGRKVGTLLLGDVSPTETVRDLWAVGAPVPVLTDQTRYRLYDAATLAEVVSAVADLITWGATTVIVDGAVIVAACEDNAVSRELVTLARSGAAVVLVSSGEVRASACSCVVEAGLASGVGPTSSLLTVMRDRPGWLTAHSDHGPPVVAGRLEYWPEGARIGWEIRSPLPEEEDSESWESWESSESSESL